LSSLINELVNTVAKYNVWLSACHLIICVLGAVGQSLQKEIPARSWHESVVLKDTMFIWGGRNSKKKDLDYNSRLDVFSVNMLSGE
jgi:hypothetical protein